MAKINFYNNLFENKCEEFSYDTSRSLIEQIEEHTNKNIYKETLVECYDSETGETFYAPLEESNEHPTVIIVVDGKSVDKEYVPKSDDLINVFFVPMSDDASTKGAIIGGVIGVAAAVAIVAISVASYGTATPFLVAAITSGISAITAGVSMGYMIGGYIDSRNARNTDSNGKKIDYGKEGKQSPDIRGASNTSLRGNNYPCVIGKHLVTPFIVGDPYTEYSGTNGEDAYIRIMYCVGYGPIKLTDFKLGEFMLAYNRSHNGITMGTMINGLLKGYSHDNVPDNGDIVDYFKNNDIELEILQHDPLSSQPNYGTIYPYAVDTQELNANLFYIADKELDEQAQVVYKGTAFPNKFRTNGVFFSASCPMKITLSLNFPSGLYSTHNYQSESSSETVYGSIPLWFCIQWRPYSQSNQTSDPNGSDYASWNNISFGESYFQTFTEEKAADDMAAHRGNDFSNIVTLTDLYGDFLDKDLNNFESLSGEDGISQIRISTTLTFTEAQCRALVSDDNPMRAIEIRVIRVSPNYINMTTNVDDTTGAYSYSDLGQVLSIVCQTYDESKLLGQGVVEPLRVQTPADMKKFCYVALKAKADSAGYIINQLDKFNCMAESFSPIWDKTQKKILPEGITKQVNYIGYFTDAEHENRCNRSNSAYEAFVTKEQYEAARHDGYNWLAIKNGSTFTGIMNQLIFYTDQPVLHNGVYCTYLPDAVKKYNDNSVASSFMLACMGAQCGPEAIGVEDINILSIADWAENTEALYDGSTFSVNTTYRGHQYSAGDLIPVHYEANAYLFSGVRMDELLSKFAVAGRAVWIVDETGKIKIVMDRAADYTKGVISAQNCLSSTNAFSYEELPAGLFLSFSDENDGYENNSIYVWSDGNNYLNHHGKVEPYAIDFVTNPYQLHSLARYFLACRVAQKEILTRKVGPEGVTFGFGDVVLVQSEDLLIGDVSGRIQEVIEDTDYIYGFVSDATYEYTGELDENNNSVQGVTILQPGYYGKSNAVTIGLSAPRSITIGTRRYTMAEGITNVVLFRKNPDGSYGVPRGNDDPSSTTDVKYNFKTGDTCLFGLLDKISAPYRIIKIKPESNGCFSETLIPYDESIYNYGAALPTFQNYHTAPEPEANFSNLSDVPTSLRELGDRENLVYARVSNLFSNHIVTLYKETNQQLTTTGITSDLIYSFRNATANWDGQGSNGWSTTYPSNPTEQVWVTSGTAFGKGATDAIHPNEWAEPIPMGMNGSNGVNTRTISLYKRNFTQPQQIPSDLTYYFSTGNMVFADGSFGWSASVPPVTEDSQPCWEIHATALSTSNTDVIPSGATWAESGWSEPVQITDSGLTKQEVLEMIGEVQNESPNVYFTPGAGIFAVDENGVIPTTQHVDITVRCVQNNEDLDFSFGSITLPDGIVAQASGNVLTLTAQEGAKLKTSYIHVPVVFYHYADNDYLAADTSGDTRPDYFAWYVCQEGYWHGDIDSIVSIPTGVVDHWFTWTGVDTESTEEIVEGGWFFNGECYYYDGTKWKITGQLPLGIDIQATDEDRYGFDFTVSTVYGGVYIGGITSISEIPDSPIIGDFFVWKGADETPYAYAKYGMLLTGSCFKWDGEEWVRDNTGKHIAEGMIDILSTAENLLTKNNSDVTSMVRELIAWNVVTQNIKVTGEAIINSTITAQLNIGKSDDTTGYIQSWNFTNDSGFRIKADGSAIFRSLKVGTGDGYTLIENGKINADLINVDNIFSKNITLTGTIKSSSWDNPSTQKKWRITNAGDLVCYNAEFYNSVLFNGEIRGGSLSIGAVSETQDVYNFKVDEYGNIYAGYDPESHQYAFTVSNNLKELNNVSVGNSTLNNTIIRGGNLQIGYVQGSENIFNFNVDSAGRIYAGYNSTTGSYAFIVNENGISLSGYATTDSLSNYATISSLSNYATKAALRTTNTNLSELSQDAIKKAIAIDSGDYYFRVDATGQLHCTNADVAGYVQAQGGIFSKVCSVTGALVMNGGSLCNTMATMLSASVSTLKSVMRMLGASLKDKGLKPTTLYGIVVPFKGQITVTYGSTSPYLNASMVLFEQVFPLSDNPDFKYKPVNLYGYQTGSERVLVVRPQRWSQEAEGDDYPLKVYAVSPNNSSYEAGTKTELGPVVSIKGVFGEIV